MTDRPPCDHVLVLTQHYWPDPNFITRTVAERLGKDARVTVVTSHPNYPRGVFAAGYPFWRPWRRVENGVTVWRLPMIPDRSASIIRRAISYLSFTIPAMIAAPLVGADANIVWVYQTPFTTALAAWYHHYVRNAKIVFTVADLWPESFVAVGVVRNRTLMKTLLQFRKWLNSWATLIICSTEGTRDVFESEGVNSRNLERVPIWVEGIPADLPSPIEKQEQKIFYGGNLGPAQALDTVVRAAAILRDRIPSLSFRLYGTGSEEARLKQLASSLEASNVHFLGTVSPSEAFGLARKSLAQIVCLRPSQLFEMTIPSKLVFALAVGTPILSGLRGEAAEIALASGAALAFDASNAESLVSAIVTLVEKTDSQRRALGLNGQQYYLSQFELSRSLEQYHSLILGPQAVDGASGCQFASETG